MITIVIIIFTVYTYDTHCTLTSSNVLIVVHSRYSQ